MKITKGMKVEFENGHDVHRGTILDAYVDPSRPDMEETWTVLADSVLKRTPTGATKPGKPIIGRDGKPLVGVKGEPKLALEPVYTEEWLALAPAPSAIFRVRARRMKTL